VTFARLKKWRLAKAQSSRLPAYMICSDITLQHLAQARPGTLDALASVHGPSDAKIKRYDEELLAVLGEISD